MTATAADRLRYVGRRLWHARTGARFITALFVVNAALALLDWFLAGPGWRVVDWEARRRLTLALGPADSYQVTLYASWLDLLVGDVPDQVIRARRVHMKDGLVVENLEVRLRGLTMWNKTVTRLDEATYRATVTQDGLEEYLRRRGLRLIIAPGRLEVRGYQSILGLPVPLDATGTLRVVGETRVRFVFDEASIARVRLPVMIHEITVLDLEDWPFGIRVEDLRVGDGYLAVAGRAVPRLPLILKPSEASPSPSGRSSP